VFPERTRRPRGIRRAVGTLAIFATFALLSGCSQAAAEEHPVRKHHSPAPSQSPVAARPLPADAGTPVPVATFDKHAASTDDPASYWVVANKSRPLQPVDYAPTDLVYPDVPNVNGQPMRADVAAAVVAMFAASRSEAGLGLSVQSAYRSYETQVRVYNDDVAANGREYADTDTARPGHSEHQTGLAVDISAVPANCSLDACFGQTAQGRWLAANAWRFGFLLRYPADKVDVTGFTYEPWHFRYIGADLAAELHKTGVTTLEEFFGLPGGTSYQ
jgi:D-alanyl-D-alanine carboxypeptidase